MQTELICRGCYALGSACGMCTRCVDEQVKLKQQEVIQAMLGTAEAHLQALEWGVKERTLERIVATFELVLESSGQCDRCFQRTSEKIIRMKRTFGDSTHEIYIHGSCLMMAVAEAR